MLHLLHCLLNKEFLKKNEQSVEDEGIIRIQEILEELEKKLLQLKDHLIDTQAIHTPYTIKAHYEHS